jgi:signal transduction histidine kinase
MAENLQFNFVLVYFVYGLAFFSMGLGMAIEVGRAPRLAEARLLGLLAFFGLVHGTHEWMEIFLMVRQWFGLGNPAFIPLVRLVLLVVSFASLALYGLEVLRPRDRLPGFSNATVVLGLLVIYAGLLTILLLSPENRISHWVEHADALARYILAAPGAGMAALALNRQARQAQGVGRRNLSLSLRLAGVGFAIYALTQFLVSPVDFFPAQALNSALFYSWTGVPIQAVRASMAVLIMVGLMRATQVVEVERTRELVSAQEARLQAVEQLQRDTAERELQRRELLRHIVLAQEEERARIARELHDETSQYLTALSLDLATVKRLIRRKPEASRILERLQTMSRQVSQGIYRMIRDLRPAQLDDLGLVAALGYLVDEARSNGLEVTLAIEGGRQRLEPLVETVLFRIAQEALTNVARHAGCGEATVRLEFAPSQAMLSVEDHGIGFNPAASRLPPHGWGLEGMRERAESVGGRFEIRSAPGDGTRVEVVVPILVSEPVIPEENAHEYDKVDVGR